MIGFIQGVIISSSIGIALGLAGAIIDGIQAVELRSLVSCGIYRSATEGNVYDGTIADQAALSTKCLSVMESLAADLYTMYSTHCVCIDKNYDTCYEYHMGSDEFTCDDVLHLYPKVISASCAFNVITATLCATICVLAFLHKPDTHQPVSKEVSSV